MSGAVVCSTARRDALARWEVGGVGRIIRSRWGVGIRSQSSARILPLLTSMEDCRWFGGEEGAGMQMSVRVNVRPDAYVAPGSFLCCVNLTPRSYRPGRAGGAETALQREANTTPGHRMPMHAAGAWWAVHVVSGRPGGNDAAHAEEADRSHFRGPETPGRDAAPARPP